MNYLIYVSRATVSMDQDSLGKLLELCVHRNRQNDVTGLLIYKGPFGESDSGYFMQYLEGPSEALSKTQKRIAADDRHTDVHVLKSGTSDSRRFPEWSMALRYVDGKELAGATGYADLGSTEFWDRARNRELDKENDLVRYFVTEDV